jgi:hypothetical protein
MSFAAAQQNKIYSRQGSKQHFLHPDNTTITEKSDLSLQTYPNPLACLLRCINPVNAPSGSPLRAFQPYLSDRAAPIPLLDSDDPPCCTK